MISDKCDICKVVIEAKDKGCLARSMGMHKRFTHGIIGKHHLRNKSTRKEAQLATAASLDKPKRKQFTPVPCPLDYCPHCGSRFYISKPGTEDQ